MIDVEGIVLNTKSYKDSSIILDILTKEYGLIGVIAKGAKSLKSKLRSVSDKFTYAVFTIYYKEDKLSILSEADVIDNFITVKTDIEKISYVSFLCDLTQQVYKQNNNSDLYDILISAIKKINENFNPLIITNIVELKYLDYLGVMMSLDGCSVCGSKNVVTLSQVKGGFICKNCLTNEKILDGAVLKLIRMYYYVDISKISKLDIKSNYVNEVNNFIDSYYDDYTGLYLKSKTFLKNLIKLK